MHSGTLFFSNSWAAHCVKKSRKSALKSWEFFMIFDSSLQSWGQVMCTVGRCVAFICHLFELWNVKKMFHCVCLLMPFVGRFLWFFVERILALKDLPVCKLLRVTTLLGPFFCTCNAQWLLLISYLISHACTTLRKKLIFNALSRRAHTLVKYLRFVLLSVCKTRSDFFHPDT